jgi:hypothetical protein
MALVDTRALIYTAAPPGRGFTGSIDIWTADENRCPAGLLASQPFLPISGWNPISWEEILVSDAFVVTVAMAGPALPSRFASDHPASGPIGSQACGTCYLLHRLTHSYDYGVLGAFYCPGETVNDGVCDVEWVWDVALSCESVVGAGDWSSRAGSWASIKALYR